ncbi:MAG TPA: hypothetical protein VKA13_00295 [Gammaproteobacteria bacterium]|nr:hypothetical protein [Gammaproteobacteria bacterium]
MLNNPLKILCCLTLAATLLAANTARAQGGASQAPVIFQKAKWYDLPLFGFRAGGYISLQFLKLRGNKWEFTPHDLSLFLSRDFSSRLHFFSEAEIGDAFVVSGSHISTRRTEVDLERFYLDYQATTRAGVRFGKFLTPVGRWNLIHADPLVWTVSRPLTTAAAFSRHASGLMLHGTLPVGRTDMDYSVYADDSDALDPTQRNELAFPDPMPVSTFNPRNVFKHAFGLRLVHRSFNDSLQVGFSAAHFQLEDIARSKNLLGTDVFWTVNRIEISAEGIYRTNADNNSTDEWGGFVQLVVPLSHHLYAVGRHERFKAHVVPEAATIQTLGIIYAPTPPVKIKFEHRGGRHNGKLAPDGWFASFSMLL